MIRHSFCVVISFVLAFGTVATARAAERITITGSSTVAPLVAEIGKEFEDRNPSARVDVQSGGSTRGIIDVRSGVSDVGMISRELSESESDLVGFVIARDGIAIILHKTNDVPHLSDSQIIDIFTGRITHWEEIGGRAGRISVVNKAAGRSTLELFLAHFKLDAREISAHVVIGDNQQGIKTVAANPGAIGYVSIGTAEIEASAGTPIRILGLKGVEATTENVGTGVYPLTRPLVLVVQPAAVERMRKFIEFAQSAEVHDIISEQFFVPSHH